jgi:hypothetical protein
MLSLQQILNTPLGKTPTIQELQDLTQHVINNQDDISGMSGGGAPGFNSAIDTRWSLLETGGVTNTYVAEMNDAASNQLAEGFNYWLYGIALTNTGDSTLDVGTIDLAVPIMKITISGLVQLGAGDLPITGAYLYYSSASSAWILINPVDTGIEHITQTTVPTDPSLYNEGDLIYVVES